VSLRLVGSPDNRPRLLDLFSGAGGAGRGYQNAGFHVTGVDIVAQPEYGGDVFVKGDALEYLDKHWHEFDAIHASPPCQSSSTLTKGTNKGREYLDLIPQTRDMLSELSQPSVIENVSSADVRQDLTLCGEMFGLGVIRHRWFELIGWCAQEPEHVPHRGRVAGYRHGVWYKGPYVAVYGKGGGKGTIPEWQSAMETPWISKRRSLAQAIPPAYTEYIGRQLMAQIANGTMLAA